MDLLFSMLAQAAAEPPVGPDGKPIVPPDEPVPDQFFGRVPFDEIREFITSISWLQAVVCVAFATIYLIYGWRVFKVLVVLNFAIIGLILGRFAGGAVIPPLWGGIFGTVLLAAISWPFMKYSVSVLGAVAGAVLGAALWQAFSLPPKLYWCGAMTGLVAGAFMAFSSFKVSIMLFTTLQGSVFLTIGMLALLNDYPEFGPHLWQAVYTRNFTLPAFLIIPTAISIYVQHKLLKLENDWSMPE